MLPTFSEIEMVQLECPGPGLCKRFIYADDHDTVTIIAFDDNGWSGQHEYNKRDARLIWESLISLGWKSADPDKLSPELKRQLT